MNGRVIDGQTREPMYSVNIYWRDENGIAHGVHSERDGTFDLPSATGKPEVFFSHMGYEGLAAQGVPGPVEVMLFPSLEELPEVIIYPDEPSNPSQVDAKPVLVGAGLFLLLLALSDS